MSNFARPPVLQNAKVVAYDDERLVFAPRKNADGLINTTVASPIINGTVVQILRGSKDRTFVSEGQPIIAEADYAKLGTSVVIRDNQTGDLHILASLNDVTRETTGGVKMETKVGDVVHPWVRIGSAGQSAEGAAGIIVSYRLLDRDGHPQRPIVHSKDGEPMELEVGKIYDFGTTKDRLPEPKVSANLETGSPLTQFAAARSETKGIA